MGSKYIWKHEIRNTKGYSQTIRGVCDNYTAKSEQRVSEVIILVFMASRLFVFIDKLDMEHRSNAYTNAMRALSRIYSSV